MRYAVGGRPAVLAELAELLQAAEAGDRTAALWLGVGGRVMSLVAAGERAAGVSAELAQACLGGRARGILDRNLMRPVWAGRYKP